MELGFTTGDAPADPNEKAVAPDARKQSWIAALGVLFTFSAASALVQLLIGLAEAKLNVLNFGSESTSLSSSISHNTNASVCMLIGLHSVCLTGAGRAPCAVFCCRKAPRCRVCTFSRSSTASLLAS